MKKIILLDERDRLIAKQAVADYKIALLDELEPQLAFEKEVLKSKERDWNPEYHKGYISGMKQTIDVIKED